MVHKKPAPDLIEPPKRWRKKSGGKIEVVVPIPTMYTKAGVNQLIDSRNSK